MRLYTKSNHLYGDYYIKVNIVNVTNTPYNKHIRKSNKRETGEKYE